jgi:hypothetical protein
MKIIDFICKINKKINDWLVSQCEKPIESPWLYSELIKKFPIHGEIGNDDIIHISHKLENGKYETCFITIEQLKKAIIDGN